MRRVLIISYYFPPMAGVEVQRVTRFVRHLPQYGWEPAVVTSKGGHWNFHDESLLQSLPADINILRVRAVNHPGVVHKLRLLEAGLETWHGFQRSGKLRDRLRRRFDAFDTHRLCFPDEQNWWAWNARRGCRALVERFQPDAIWATGPPWSNLVLSHRISGETGIPAVADIRDPWTWHPQGLWKGERHGRLEGDVLNGHAHVVTVTEGFRRRYAELYPELAGRIHLIRNGFEDADLGTPGQAPSIVNIHYLGSLTTGNLKDVRKRTLYLFLKALQALRLQGTPGAEQIRVKVAGRNVEASQTLVDELGLNDQVQILGPLPASEARALRDEADALLLVDMLYENSDSTFIALKVYEYLAANRPILALLPPGSEAGKIILEKRRGIVCRVDDVDSIATGLQRLLQGDFEYDHNSDVSEFSCRNATQQLAAVLTAAASRAK